VTRYVLDTNVASESLNPRPDPVCKAWLANQDPATLHLTAATVAKFRYGVALARRRGKANLAILEAKLAVVEAANEILPLDGAAAAILGEFWAHPDLLDFVVTQPAARQLAHGGDLLIAAIAIRHGATIVTRDIADYQRIAAYGAPIRLYDPFTGAAH
jgi:predicted nucleic acid-binding protein